MYFPVVLYSNSLVSRVGDGSQRIGNNQRNFPTWMCLTRTIVSADEVCGETHWSFACGRGAGDLTIGIEDGARSA
jgi:hypothetical protein